MPPTKKHNNINLPNSFHDQYAKSCVYDYIFGMLLWIFDKMDALPVFEPSIPEIKAWKIVKTE